MKNILLLLSCFLMSLLSVRGIEGALPSEEGMGVECVLQAEMPMGAILPSVTEIPDEGEACVDVESLARQYRVSGRGHRSLSVQQMFFGKSSAYRDAKRCLEMLYHTVKNVYHSLPCQSWVVSSDHYVFGLRRILI